MYLDIVWGQSTHYREMRLILFPPREDRASECSMSKGFLEGRAERRALRGRASTLQVQTRTAQAERGHPAPMLTSTPHTGLLSAAPPQPRTAHKQKNTAEG